MRFFQKNSKQGSFPTSRAQRRAQRASVRHTCQKSPSRQARAAQRPMESAESQDVGRAGYMQHSSVTASSFVLIEIQSIAALMPRRTAAGRLDNVWPMPKHARSTSSERRSENRTQGFVCTSRVCRHLFHLSPSEMRDQEKMMARKRKRNSYLHAQSLPDSPTGVFLVHMQKAA